MITEMDIIPVLAEHVLLWPTARLGCVSALRTQDAHRSTEGTPPRGHVYLSRAHHGHQSSSFTPGETECETSSSLGIGRPAPSRPARAAKTKNRSEHVVLATRQLAAVAALGDATTSTLISGRETFSYFRST